jgi:hemerythrin superfamily protein
MEQNRRNVIDVLTQDHREVEDMFAELARETDPEERRRIADDVTIELVRHAVAEEMHLYPAVRQYVTDGDEIADKELADHAEVERLLKELGKTDPATPDFDTLVRRLVENVTSHVQDEEGNLFPALAKYTTHDDLLDLGEKVQSAKAAGDRKWSVRLPLAAMPFPVGVGLTA